MMRHQSQVNGYLTVFLSLSITVILSLVLALFQGARVSAFKMKSEIISDVAMKSVLSEYSRELYEQYGILMVDTSYGQKKGGIINAQDHLKYYIEENTKKPMLGYLQDSTMMNSIFLKEAAITGSSFAADGNGAVLRNQIIEYMEAVPFGDSISKVSDNLGILQYNGYDTEDISAKQTANQQIIDDYDLGTTTDDDGNEVERTLDNPADNVNSQRSVGILNLISGQESISNVSVDLSKYLSQRKINHGTGLGETENTGIPEKLLIDEYIFEKCGNYRKTLDKSKLKYQIEYIIAGENNDYSNLEKVCEKLLFWREASNFSYIMTNEGFKEAALTAATLIAALAGAPALTEPIQYSILFAWSFAESISDISILLKGGKVPIIKTAGTWKLSIEGMLDFKNNLNSDCKEGLKYEDYLRMLLFTTETGDKTTRLMDIMEMDIRKTKGNKNFKLDYCLDKFCGLIKMQDKSGFNFEIERIYGFDK
ncbi:MAG: DUF5702 domain-containing protein [Butyrivibrio sp.]|nr:DUF5702 domain-containing protein [Butyrivibrio sp.]